MNICCVCCLYETTHKNLMAYVSFYYFYIVDNPCVDTDVICPGLHTYCDNENVIVKCPKTCNKCSKYLSYYILETAFRITMFCVCYQLTLAFDISNTFI